MRIGAIEITPIQATVAPHKKGGDAPIVRTGDIRSVVHVYAVNGHGCGATTAFQRSRTVFSAFGAIYALLGRTGIFEFAGRAGERVAIAFRDEEALAEALACYKNHIPATIVGQISQYLDIV